MTTPRWEIAKEYVTKYRTLGSKKIARLLVADLPGEFRDVEQARRMVRYYRGASGDYNRKTMNPDSYIPAIDAPEAEDENYEPFVLPSDSSPLIVGGDVHIPYHDQDALELFIEQAVKIKAKTVLLAGDWIDCYQLSRFCRDPRMRNIAEEIAVFNEVVGIIKKALPDARIIFKYGNHEERYDTYIMRQAPELFGLPEIHLDSMLKLKDQGIQLVDNRRVIKLDHLHIIHGHEYVYSISNPVNPARGLYNRAKKSALCFHHHQTSEHTESSINGDIVTTWSGGCLCGLHPQYMPLNKWNHGFVEITNDDGFYRVTNRRIVNYRVM